MKTQQAHRNVVTALLALSGVALMVSAPIFGAQLLSGVFFFGGAALTLTSLVARVKHSLMADMHPANYAETSKSFVAEKESV